ncbi:MAG: glycine cleavage system protein GcvH [Firmicutes bacterium]|nr:glycine cleavage system protein GcvH [Bacillota bacterium]
MDVQGYSLPDELYYDTNHSWGRVEGDIMVVGINDFAQKLAGEFVSVDLPPEGKKVQQGKPLASVESGKWVGRVYAPVSGEIVEVNEALEDDPTVLNSDPYGYGWVAKIKFDNPAELENLLQAGKAAEWLEEEIAKHVKK